MMKKFYSTPLLLIHGKVEMLTCGSRIWLEDAWFGADGTDGIIGRKCQPDEVGDRWYEACGS